MANQYLINVKQTPVKAWVFIGIINGLEEMFRIKIPVLDVFGSKDWEVTQVGAYEREKQISKIARSRQVVVKDAPHFFEGRKRTDRDRHLVPGQRLPATAGSAAR